MDKHSKIVVVLEAVSSIRSVPRIYSDSPWLLLWSERMLRKHYDLKGSVVNKYLIVSLKKLEVYSNKRVQNARLGRKGIPG
jgi:hypothetical protein